MLDEYKNEYTDTKEVISFIEESIFKIFVKMAEVDPALEEEKKEIESRKESFKVYFENKMDEKRKAYLEKLETEDIYLFTERVMETYRSRPIPWWCIFPSPLPDEEIKRLINRGNIRSETSYSPTYYYKEEYIFKVQENKEELPSCGAYTTFSLLGQIVFGVVKESYVYEDVENNLPEYITQQEYGRAFSSKVWYSDRFTIEDYNKKYDFYVRGEYPAHIEYEKLENDLEKLEKIKKSFLGCEMRTYILKEDVQLINKYLP